MNAYIDIRGVRTWWDVHGEGAPLVLLHPGGADSRSWDDNLPALAASFKVYRFDRRGQGRSDDPGGPITFDDLADDIAAFIETVIGAPAHLVGHSIGAPLGLLVAQCRPDLVRRLICSEGVYHHTGWLPGVLDPLPPDAYDYLGELHAEVSPDGPDHWGHLWPRLDAEHHRAPTLTEGDLAAISTPTLLMFADNETEVSTDHAHSWHRAMPCAQLAVVPNSTHGLPLDRPALFTLMVTEFLNEDAP